MAWDSGVLGGQANRYIRHDVLGAWEGSWLWQHRQEPRLLCSVTLVTGTTVSHFMVPCGEIFLGFPIILLLLPVLLEGEDHVICELRRRQWVCSAQPCLLFFFMSLSERAALCHAPASQEWSYLCQGRCVTVLLWNKSGDKSNSWRLLCPEPTPTTQLFQK